MEWGTVSNRAMEYIRKYRYVLLVVLAGVFLMAFPEGSSTEKTEDPIQKSDLVQPDLQKSLAHILSGIEGAGKVDVLLSVAEGEKTLYQMDENISNGSTSEEIRKDTVLITGSDRKEDGLIKQTNPPRYLGAIVLCQGADRAGIRLSIVEAVMDVTGLTSDKITVLKMK